MANADWQAISRQARHVLKTYSTSFFLVTRFLPAAKRREVEVVYAAVRYPDEVVDTFPLPAYRRQEFLDEFGRDYEEGLSCSTVEEALSQGCAPFAAASRGWLSPFGAGNYHHNCMPRLAAAAARL